MNYLARRRSRFAMAAFPGEREFLIPKYARWVTRFAARFEGKR